MKLLSVFNWAMGDVFADLLSSKPKPKLLQQLGTSSATNAKPASNNHLDLDFLDSYVSKQTPARVPAGNATNLLDDLDFGVAQLNVSESSQSRSPAPAPASAPSAKGFNGNLLDDIDFSFPEPAPVQRQTSPAESFPASTASRASQNTNADANLAALLDMGFELPRAQRALEETNNNLDSAIGYLMNNAPRHQTAVPVLPERADYRSMQMEDPLASAFSKASSFFQSGKKLIQKEISTYMNNPAAPANLGNGSNRQPAWMNQSEIHSKHDSTVHESYESQEELPRRNNRIKRKPSPAVSAVADSASRNTSPTSPENNVVVGSLLNGFDDPVSKSTSLSASPSAASKMTGSTPLSYEPISSFQRTELTTLRSKANDAFKLGDYSAAIAHYQDALNILPSEHPLTINLMSNLSLCCSKQGDTQSQLAFAQRGLDIIQKRLAPEEVEREIEQKSVKSYLIKLLVKKSQALESLEKWPEALESYNELINWDSGVATRDGRRRCMDAMKPKETPKPAATTGTAPLSQRAPAAAATPAKKVDIDSSEAVKRMREETSSQTKVDEERLANHDAIQEKIQLWRHGNEANIRALLSTLDKILWPELGWKPINLTDLVLDKKVKMGYMKAVAKVHPDKIPAGTSVAHKMLAEGVFVTLNDAWEAFKK